MNRRLLLPCLAVCCGLLAAEACAVEPEEPADLVNPLIDTAAPRCRWLFFASACRPFGMVNLSPDMELKGTWGSGYLYDKDKVQGFSHVHAWQLGAIPVMPTTGPLRGPQGPEAYGSRYSHETEKVRPGYHRITLEDYGIQAELTSTDRVGFHRWTFARKDEAHVLLDLGTQCGPSPTSDALARRVSDTEVEGYAVSAPTRRRPKPCAVHFVARFDRPMVGFGGWEGGVVLDGVNEVSGADSGAFARFAVKAGDVVQMKLAISYVSTDEARRNLDAELPHWDFDRTAAESREVWNDWLGRIEVEGGTHDQRVRFYTDLWHVLLGRRMTSDASGKYCDMTGPKPVVRQIPLDKDGRPKYAHFNGDAFWNTFWNINVVWSLAYPDVTRQWVNFLVDMYKDGGLVPRGPSCHNYTFVMISAHSTPFIVGAYMKGIRDFDVGAAYEGMRKNAFPGGLMSKAGYEHDTCLDGGVEYYIERGFIPDDRKCTHGWHADGAAQTLEYAYDDWCLAQMARALGKEDDYRLFTARAGNYRNMYDAETDFMRPRNSDGSWLAPFDPAGPKGWCEGTAWQYTWFVPHDVEGLARLMGGHEAFVLKLNEAFRRAAPRDFLAPEVNYGNQPSIAMAHLFNYAGAPWLSQKWVREVKERTFGGVTPQDGYRGDEDQGQAGGLGVLMALGLFEVRGGAALEPVYEITSPVFDRITIHLDERYYPGGKFVITTRNNSPESRYIQSATLDGKPLERPWFYHRELVDGGVLALELGPEPNRIWGSRPQDAPPSMTRELAAELRVGAAAAELVGDDSMVIAGGILPRYVKGQEGKLRAVAVVLEKPGSEKVAVVACDVLMLTRDLLDPVAAEVERRCGIPAENVLIHATHTHHAPSTCRVHGYDRDRVFCGRVQRAVVEAVAEADARLAGATFQFKRAEEKTVGKNSRLLLADGNIFWIGNRDDAVRPTGPFDPDVPVLVFRDPNEHLVATVFGHSTHTIGALTGNVRSPAFYGMAAQKLGAELGGTFCFLEGASGSTHRMDVGATDAAERIEAAVRQAVAKAEPRGATRLAAIKRPFHFKVRTFDEEAEDKAVSDYCRNRSGRSAEPIVEVFRRMRRELAPQQGDERSTWVQVVLIGDVAIVGVPGEFFTSLGVDLKRRSPFTDTFIAELANDWIGYLPDREAHKLGGYQVWTGLHSYTEPGTGERIVDQAVEMLEELAEASGSDR